MRADSIAKDASTLPQSAAPVDFSTAKTVIRHHCARRWGRMAKPAVHHATYVNSDQKKDFTPSQKTLLSHLRTGRHTPELAWYCHRIMRNQDQPEPATCQRCGQAEETLVQLMTECPVLEDALSHNFNEDDLITFLFNELEVALSYLRDAGLTKDGRIWSLIERQKKTITTARKVNVTWWKDRSLPPGLWLHCLQADWLDRDQLQTQRYPYLYLSQWRNWKMPRVDSLTNSVVICDGGNYWSQYQS